MKFTPLPLDGAWLITMPTHHDVRGTYRTLFNRDEFEKHGLIGTYAESGIATNPLRGTVRGMHFQKAPYAQAKLVRCVEGMLVDVIIDLRPDSLTYLQHHVVWLCETKPTMLYVPKGFAHGYQTMEPDTVVEYHMSEVHTPAAASGVRYDDPVFGIKLPLVPEAILERDTAWPDYQVSHAQVD